MTVICHYISGKINTQMMTTEHDSPISSVWMTNFKPVSKILNTKPATTLRGIGGLWNGTVRYCDLLQTHLPLLPSRWMLTPNDRPTVDTMHASGRASHIQKICSVNPKLSAEQASPVQRKLGYCLICINAD